MVLFSVSCTNWLDVTPKDTIAEDDLFKVATGYKNAINGVYKQISGTSLYGRELSWGLVDALGQCYEAYSLNPSSPYGVVANKYDYKNQRVKDCISGVWSKAYNSIANCNNILGRIDGEADSKFKEGKLEKELIKGEALALRAFIHFDMVRLFAAAPIKESSEKYIPYYENYPSTGEPNESVDVLMAKVIRDLKQAQELVARFDTLDRDHRIWLAPNIRFTTTGSASNLFSTELFFSHRGYRLNYLAITAILARAYNYVGEHSKAVEEAQKVIDFKTSESNSAFVFTESTRVESNRKLSDDVIFTLSYLKLYNDYAIFTTESNDDVNRTPLNIGNYYSMFDDAGDYRKKLLSQIGYKYTSNKNMKPTVLSTESSMVEDMLPIVRMSEMHFIIAEKCAAEGDFAGAAAAMDVVRGGRNCTIGNLFIYDNDSFISEMLNEVKREFFGEGQLFFYHKKFNSMPGYSMPSDESFILPRPENEDIH